MEIDPLSGLVNPTIRLRRVDLPLPVGPINTIIVLSCNFRLIGPNVNPRNDLIRLIISIVKLISLFLPYEPPKLKILSFFLLSSFDFFTIIEYTIMRIIESKMDKIIPGIACDKPPKALSSYIWMEMVWGL